MKPDSDLYSFLRSKDFVEEEEPASNVDPGSTADSGASSSQEAVSLDFEDSDLVEKLCQYSDAELNEVDFGIVKVDNDGTVLFYNEYEARNAGVRPEDAEGKDFFTQVAPCSNNRIFRGRFKEGMMKGTLDETFTYTFTYKMSPTLVDVRMLRDERSNNWLLIRFRYAK